MQNELTTIDRKPLREEIYARLRDRIIAGAFPPGSRLQDVRVAAELGVSRTPVREALLRLVKEGLVESDPNRGFFVAPLSRAEVLEIYPIIWTLECMALKASPPPTLSQIQALKQINADMASVAADPLRRLELDMRWHHALVELSGNQRLMDVLAGLKQLVRRYETVYMQDQSLVRQSTLDHAAIIEALRLKKTKMAAEQLKENWRRGMDWIVKRLDESAPPPAK
jgi:DNA-binding GntR family transcriptional regulator